MHEPAMAGDWSFRLKDSIVHRLLEIKKTDIDFVVLFSYSFSTLCGHNIYIMTVSVIFQSSTSRRVYRLRMCERRTFSVADPYSLFLPLCVTWTIVDTAATSFKDAPVFNVLKYIQRIRGSTMMRYVNIRFTYLLNFYGALFTFARWRICRDYPLWVLSSSYCCSLY